jgi:FeS assembly SUF system protein
MDDLTPGAEAGAAPKAGTLRERVEDVLRTVHDPEIPVNIYELGLVYDLDVTDDGVVAIKMTLTAPNCPAAGAMPSEVEAKVRAVEGVTDAKVELVWDPPWDRSRMSEAARLELGFM